MMKKIITIFCLSISFFLTQTAAQTQQSDELQKEFSAKITSEDMRIFLVDSNPAVLRNLANDEQAKQNLIKSFKELLAVAIEAVKNGLADREETSAELENIRIQITAANYDKWINKNSDSPFSLITEKQVAEYLAKPENQKAFDKFLQTKLKLSEAGGISLNKTEISEEQIAGVRDYFAKSNIYAEESKAKADSLGAEYKRKVELQIKIQKAQFLAQIFSREILEKTAEVTDEDVQKYVADNPQFDTQLIKDKAREILLRAKSGEDFAKLAEEFSDDPGSKYNGGLYQNINNGQFIPEFEQAALSLEAGQIYPELVETKFGFHIIKLEKKRPLTGATDAVGNEKPMIYDVRHILISTMITDPQSPGLPITLKEKIKVEKRKKLLAEITANNPVEIEDFEVPLPVGDDTPENTLFPPEVADFALPTEVSVYLDKNHKDWKLSKSPRDCGTLSNVGYVKGFFNKDKKEDYAVKFTSGEKGYIIAFLSKKMGFEAVVLHDDYKAEELDEISFGVLEKGQLFTAKNSLKLKRDAIRDFRCSSDVGNIHLYENGKFVMYNGFITKAIAPTMEMKKDF